MCLLLGAAQVWAISTGEATSDLIINEFLAANGTGLADEDGDYSDWIEIYNRGHEALNLAGWSLTDDPDQPDKWTFPGISLGSGQYLVVFASGKNRKSTKPGTTLHTNFKLSKGGEFLALYNIFDTGSSEVTLPQFPKQLRDIAYGLHSDQLAYGYLAAPTPGGPNDEALVWEDFVSPVEFSVERGIYDKPFSLALSTSTAGAAIRYTTDNSEPTEAKGQIYTQPILIEATTAVRAVAFNPNFLPSHLDTHTYIFLDQVLVQPEYPPGFPPTWGNHPEDVQGYKKGDPVKTDYEMDPEVVNDPRYRDIIKNGLKSIPSISIVTAIGNLDTYTNPALRGAAWERPVSVEFIYPGHNSQNFQINAGLRIQGGVGRASIVPKHSFRLFFKGKYDATKLEQPLFPDSPVETFDTLVLRAGVNRSYAGYPGANDQRLTTYTRDEWLRASQIAMSGTGSHGIFVHLYFDGLYWGLYNVVERPDASFASSYLGGEKEDWYAANHSGPISGSGDRFETLDRLIGQGGLENPEKYAAVQTYLDTVHFSDYVILNWYAGNEDWGANNWYAVVQNPVGRVNYFAWDAERTWVDGARVYFGKRTYLRRPNRAKTVFEALMQNPDFKMEFADRLYTHLFNDGALTDANSQARWMDINNSIAAAITAESARWGDAEYDRPITPDDWLKARDNVLAQMEGNAAKFIAFAREAGYYPDIDPPTFNRPGGLVAAGFNLVMALRVRAKTEEGGTIYYTTDGSDPRVQVTGEVAPGAIAYNFPIVLTNTTHIKARVLAGDPSKSPAVGGQVWSALNEAVFRVAERDHKLRITEIMYNPAGVGDYEFVELKNIGDGQLSLSNMSFAGINFTFPPHTAPLAPGEFVVLAGNRQAFAERYPGIPIGGAYDGRLSNKGEKIALKDAQGNVIASVEYDDENGWPISPDGRGDSLVLIDLEGDPDNPKNWRASANLNGSPGVDEPAP